eukprot:1158306-Pelagomonas_calceolata.AAC.6
MGAQSVNAHLRVSGTLIMGGQPAKAQSEILVDGHKSSVCGCTFLSLVESSNGHEWSGKAYYFRVSVNWPCVLGQQRPI